MYETFRLAAVLSFLAFALAACGGGDGTGIDDGAMNNGGGGGGGGTTPTVKADPSFASDIQEIFNRNGCAASACHGSAQEAGLDLRQGNSYANLVSVASTQTGIHRVIPGNAAGSYIIMKVEGTASVGSKMPVGGNLNSTDLTNLRNWINQGAKNN